MSVTSITRAYNIMKLYQGALYHPKRNRCAHLLYEFCRPPIGSGTELPVFVVCYIFDFAANGTRNFDDLASRFSISSSVSLFGSYTASR